MCPTCVLHVISLDVKGGYRMMICYITVSELKLLKSVTKKTMTKSKLCRRRHDNSYKLTYTKIRKN
jgi:hypothetical protein